MPMPVASSLMPPASAFRHLASQSGTWTLITATGWWRMRWWGWWRPMPEFIDPVFTKTSPKRSFSLNRKWAFWLVFVKTGSIISRTRVTARGRRSPRLATAARRPAYSPRVGREGGAGSPTTRKDGKILFFTVLLLCWATNSLLGCF